MSNTTGYFSSQDQVYLNEDRANEPKEIFKVFRNILLQRNETENMKVLDIGCATGEFLYYLKGELPDGSFHGMDISSQMIKYAEDRYTNMSFSTGDINSSLTTKRQYDIITCSGVLSYFDDISLPIQNILSFANTDATILILIPTTRRDVDVNVRYKRTTVENQPWEGGWNLFSNKTVERILASLPYKLELTWIPFKMPFSIPERPDDPMRNWTVSLEDDPFQTINGANQIIDITILKISLLSID